MTTTFNFHGDLPLLLKSSLRGSLTLDLSIKRKASIKDTIEAFGLPHTEIGSILLTGREIDFSYTVEDNKTVEVFPVLIPWDVFSPSALRPEPVSAISFIVDVNVGRLARYLRAAGFDTLYDRRWGDEYIAELISGSDRVLLTRDKRLLMRKQVRFGRYIRAIDPVDQLQEVIGLFGLEGKFTPFTRCLKCNSVLQPVAKAAIIHRLEPLTIQYYRSFSLCPDCDKIYWAGSHIDKMRRLFSSHLESRS